MNTRPFSRHNRLHSLWREKGLAFVAIETVEEIGWQMGRDPKRSPTKVMLVVVGVVDAVLSTVRLSETNPAALCGL